MKYRKGIIPKQWIIPFPIKIYSYFLVLILEPVLYHRVDTTGVTVIFVEVIPTTEYVLYGAGTVFTEIPEQVGGGVLRVYDVAGIP